MKTALIVDDSYTMVLSLEATLRDMGLKVETAANGYEALAMLNAGLKPDIIITDYTMPKINGVELIREVRMLPAFRFIPILMLTTESHRPRREEGKAAGATAWMVKPVPGSELMKIVKQVLPGV